MAQVDRSRSPLESIRPLLGGPITSTILIAGVLFIALGAVLQTGVWAGMFGIIGGLLVLLSVTSRMGIWIYQRL